MKKRFSNHNGFLSHTVNILNYNKPSVFFASSPKRDLFVPKSYEGYFLSFLGDQTQLWHCNNKKCWKPKIVESDGRFDNFYIVHNSGTTGLLAYIPNMTVYPGQYEDSYGEDFPRTFLATSGSEQAGINDYNGVGYFFIGTGHGQGWFTEPVAVGEHKNTLILTPNFHFVSTAQTWGSGIKRKISNQEVNDTYNYVETLKNPLYNKSYFEPVNWENKIAFREAFIDK